MKVQRASLALLVALVVALGLPTPLRGAKAQEECVVTYFQCMTRAIEGAYGPAEECLADYYVCVKRRTTA